MYYDVNLTYNEIQELSDGKSLTIELSPVDPITGEVKTGTKKIKCKIQYEDDHIS